jgi:pimeloyl-ACP methyl ester carboxylesterase
VPNDLFERLLDAPGIDRTALVGVSAGGGLAIDFAIERPQRTWALVVVASGPRGIDDIPPDPRMQAFSQAIVAGDRDRAAEAIREVLRRAGRREFTLGLATGPANATAGSWSRTARSPRPS